MNNKAKNICEVIFENVLDGLVVLDASGRIVRMNRQAEELLGCSREEFLGKNIHTMDPATGLTASLLTAAPGVAVEYAVRGRDGRERLLEGLTSRTDDGAWVIVTLRAGRTPDLEQQARERKMVRAEQMAAIGQVAAGVAHELRNPLTSIKGLVQVNLREADSRGVPAEDLRVIEHEVRRMERTLQTFLDFARPPRLKPRKLELAVVVDRVYALVGGRARKQQVELRFTRPEQPVSVIGDQDQLQQLLLNLVLNALDAMPHKGFIEIELRPTRGGFVELMIRDSGPGIAPHILPKVFETFVSSKETGVGLGLPVSRRIAEDHGGTLSAYNLISGGACFVLLLPAADGNPA